MSGPERPHPSATFSGPATILTEGIGPVTALVMQRITGSDEPTPVPMTDEALGEAGRVLLVIEVDRVAAATYLVRGGHDLVLVAELAGHRRLETTRRYSLPSAANRQAPMESIEIADG